jgi:phosphohistidine phosphatase
MASTVWLLRHGDAEAHGTRDDFDRRLTARGERQAMAAGRALARLAVHIDAAYTSPRVRALDTARLACAELGCEPVVHDVLAGGFDTRDATELLAGHRGETVLLVGHEPDFSGLVAALTGARVDFKKGGLAAIGGRALLALLRPREIELVAGL